MSLIILRINSFSSSENMLVITIHVNEVVWKFRVESNLFSKMLCSHLKHHHEEDPQTTAVQRQCDHIL